ncbi:ADP-ribosylglycohydrolase family protein, partial [Streptomyces sp. SID4931]|nr:ADP-ribosylglycohydrolase family protein [Streptomyces sp. SID4931]
ACTGRAPSPPDWAAAIGPVRGSCLPSMRGYHVLDIAELLTPDDPDAGVTPERGGGREPSAVRDMASVAASFGPGREEGR